MDNIAEYVISDYCLCSATASDASTLFANSKVGIREEVKEEIVETLGGISETKHYSSCPIADITDNAITSRILDMLFKSLLPLINNILSNDYTANLHLHCILPEEYSHRRQYINLEKINTILSMIFDNNLPFTFSVSGIEEGSVNALKSCCNKYLKNEDDILIFGGLDTLVNKPTVIELLNNNKLQLDSHSQGVSPAEAGAFIVVKALLNLDSDNKGIPLARITGISDSIQFQSQSQSQPQPQKDSSSKNPLLQCIHATLQQASVSSEKITSVVYSANSSLSKSVEWHYIVNNLWPNVLPEPLRVAVQLCEIESADNPNPYIVETISCQSSLGECGAVDLALELILSIGKIQYDTALERYGLAEVTPILVCHSHDKGVSGAICLQA